jgi:hypothetical protein
LPRVHGVNSNLLTVISMVVVPAADAIASTGIDRNLCRWTFESEPIAHRLLGLPYIKFKTNKKQQKQ